MGVKRVEWLKRELVECPIYLGLCTSDEAFTKELRRLKVPRDQWPTFLGSKWADASVHHFERDGKALAIVCLRKPIKRTLIEVHGLLVHEAVHIWQEVRDNIGEKHPSAEFEAYSVQTIAQRLMEAWARA